MNTEDDEFDRIEREQKMRGVPDAIHHTDTSETLEYIQGWNDCRQAMLAEQPALATSWLYWKIDSNCRCTGPFKTNSEEEAYGPDCIDQTPLTFATPQPAQRKPLTREQVKGLMTEAGYDTASPQQRADFINGIRHGEAAHGIKENT